MKKDIPYASQGYLWKGTKSRHRCDLSFIRSRITQLTNKWQINGFGRYNTLKFCRVANVCWLIKPLYTHAHTLNSQYVYLYRKIMLNSQRFHAFKSYFSSLLVKFGMAGYLIREAILQYDSPVLYGSKSVLKPAHSRAVLRIIYLFESSML